MKRRKPGTGKGRILPLYRFTRRWLIIRALVWRKGEPAVEVAVAG